MPYKGYDTLINDINRLLSSEKIYVAAINSVLVAQKERIFVNGNAANNSKIGSYGTNPISISRKNQSRNTGKTYFKGGYREYKSLTGKGSGFVNLRNTDQMMMDLGVSINPGAKEYGIGFTNDFNADKMEWNEERFGKNIADTTEQEDSLFVSLIENRLQSL